MKEIETLITDYEKWSLTSKKAENSLYEYISNKKLKDKIWEDYDKLLKNLELVKNLVSRDKKMVVTYDKSHIWTKYYYKSLSGHRVFSPRSKNIKVDTIIFDRQALSYRSLFFEFIKNIYSIIWTKSFSFIKLDLKKFYLNIKLSHIIKAIKFLIKKTYGKMTYKWQELINGLKKYKKILFWSTGLALWNYIWKLISYIIGSYIVLKQKAKIIMFFEDDFLFLYKKDKRFDLKKKFKEIVHFLDKFWFEINIEKTYLWKLFYDELIFLWYTFWKRKQILVWEKSLLLRKYRFMKLIFTNMRIQDDKITNFVQIKKKIRSWIDGFYNYYKFVSNIDTVMKQICKFIRKLIRYVVWKKTELNLFEVNTYLSNKRFLFNKCS